MTIWIKYIAEKYVVEKNWQWKFYKPKGIVKRMKTAEEDMYSSFN